MTKLDLTKPVRTRSGKPARIICTDAMDTQGYSVIVLIKTKNLNKEEFEYSIRVTPEGRYHIEHKTDDDIFNVPDTPKLDLTKPVRTADGRKARIIFTEAKGDYPIVALVELFDEEHAWEEAKLYTKDGYYIVGDTCHSLNLINVEE